MAIGKSLPYILFLAAAVVLAAASSYAYHLDTYPGSLQKMTGEITAIDTGRSTISIKSAAGGTVEGILVTEATTFANCEHGTYANNLQKLSVGQMVSVTLYKTEGKVFADIISPAEEKC